MKRVAIYTRISRDRVGAGLGVDRQEQDCRELAERHGWTVVQVYRDNDLSAYTGKPRPGYLALLDDMRGGRLDAVLAWHTDRLHRSPAELEEYIAASEQHGIPTHTVTAGPLDLTSPSGRLVARQLGAVARYEVEHAIERQKRAKQQAAAAGEWRGGRRPYGFEDDGVTVRPTEAVEVLRASEAVLAGTSLRALAAEMNERGLVTSTGRPWRQDTVRKVLLRARNAGIVETVDDNDERREVGPARWPAIVPVETWRAVKALLENPSRRTQYSSALRWLGSGLYRGACGGTVRATTTAKTPAGKVRAIYQCRDHCVGRTAVEVDAFVRDLVVARLSRDDAIELVRQDTPVDTGPLHHQAVALRERLDQAAAMFARGELDGGQLKVATELARKQLDAVEAQIADASRGSVLAGVAGADDVAALWDEMDLARRRAIVDRLMVVTLLKTRKGRRPGWRPGESYFDSDSVRVDWR